MKTTRIDFLYTALLASVLGCLALPARAEGTRSAIEAANVRFVAAVAKGDSAGLTALYAADGQLLPAASDIVRGSAAIQKFWQGAFDSGIAAITLTTVEVFAQGATATEVGQYELRDRGGKVLDHGKYIVVWRQESGQWKLLRDMFSTSVPPAATAP
jgi:uncharacterized protein (TIGR02246 family)